MQVVKIALLAQHGSCECFQAATQRAIWCDGVDFIQGLLFHMLRYVDVCLAAGTICDLSAPRLQIVGIIGWLQGKSPAGASV